MSSRVSATERASLPGLNEATLKSSASVFPLKQAVQPFHARPFTVAAAAPQRTGGKATHPGKAILAGKKI